MVVRTLVLLGGVVCYWNVASANKCEVQGCPTIKTGYINAHVMAHSHNDAGWMFTIDNLYADNVERIYTSTFRALIGNKQRRYVSAENIFFSRWWTEQTEERRKAVRQLVQSGRLQFVGGGWTQNDEAVTHYTAIIDQMTLGLRFLNDTFGKCGRPTVAWQADPFGHSRNQAYLFAKMGFDALMLGRISRMEKQRRQVAKQLNFVWRTEPGNKHGTDLFTWVPPHTYTTPDEFCFDILACPAAASSRYLDLKEYVALDLSAYIRALARTYAPSNVPLVFGGDLAYQKALSAFDELDRLVKTTRTSGTGPKLRLAYSTPACYIKSLHNLNETWTVYRGDFFPYTDMPARTWSGFYTSRPTFKYMVRYANGFMQACKQLAVIAGGEQTSRLQIIKEAVATMQHHDAITGTAAADVVHDYTRILWRGIHYCEAAIKESVSYLMNTTHSMLKLEHFEVCHLLNISQCNFTEQHHQFTLVVYNPMSHPENITVRFPVTATDLAITDSRGTEIEAQVVNVPEHRAAIPERTSEANWEMVMVVPIPALGFAAFDVASTAQGPSTEQLQDKKHQPTAAQNFLKLERPGEFIENDRYRLEIDTTTGLVTRLYLFHQKKLVPFSQTLQAYKQNEKQTPEPPGHYIFAATGPPVDQADSVVYRVVKGPVVQEVHQIYNNYISQVIRLYKDTDTIEFQWTVGPIPLEDTVTGADITTRFETNFQNDGAFHTDGNGRQTMKRVWTPPADGLLIPSNYYPVVSWIYIQDKIQGLQLSVIPDRPQGGTSRGNGAIELMVHRRHTTTDGLGNDEMLSEVGRNGKGLVVRGKHHVFLGAIDESILAVRFESLRRVYRPVVLFGAPGLSQRAQHAKYAALRANLPHTIHVLTLEPVPDNRVIFRVEHLGIVNKSVDLSIWRLLKAGQFEDIRPTLMGANEYLENVERLRWDTGVQDEVVDDAAKVQAGGDIDKVTVLPGDIQTFVARLKYTH